MTSSEKSDYVEGERTKRAIDSNRITSSEKGDYTQKERETAMSEASEQREERLARIKVIIHS